MNFDNFLLSHKGEKSLSATLLFWGTLGILIKYLLGGHVLFGITFPIISGGDAAIIIGALGGLYTLRKSPQLNKINRSITKEDK